MNISKNESIVNSLAFRNYSKTIIPKSYLERDVAIPSTVAIASTKPTHARKNKLKSIFEFSHSPGVAKATGTTTTKPKESRTNKAVKAVIIAIL
jgi:hypothetical protein